MSLEIKIDLPAKLDFIFGEKTFLLIDSLEVLNNGDEPFQNLSLELSADLPFIEPKVWKVEALADRSAAGLPREEIKLASDFFLKMPESVVTEVRLCLRKDEVILATLKHSIALGRPQPKLSLVYDHSINYAFQQNSIPVIKELRLQNNGVARRDVIVRISTEPNFAPVEEIRIQAISAGEQFRMSPPNLTLKLSHDFLAGLDEKVAGWLKIEAVEQGEMFQSSTEPISLLARNEWCGLVALPEILAAFALPNDPAIMTILRRASEILKEATDRSSFNAYQDKSRKRAWEQIAAIYKAIGEQEIRYIVAPASFEKTGQKVRLPSDILSQKFGNCLDLSLLFASCCEQAGLRPLVFIHDGHAYSGCWLEERSLPEPACDDLQQMRKLATEEIILVFEATTIATDRPGTLDDAELYAKPHLQKDDIFRLALDVHAARSAKIMPLPVPGQARIERADEPREKERGPSDGLGKREFAGLINIVHVESAKPANRIDSWKSRLLDLSLRNRLLNLRETKATIRILSEPEHVEDELASERELSLRPKPKILSEEDPRNPAIYTREQKADALKEHLQEELAAGRIHSHLEEPEHAKRLTELYRSARNALDENGTNTLFAAVGILEWRETEHSEKVHRAPLLLVPVELKRKSVLEGFFLRRIDEETRLNVTLMEMLKQNFRKEIPGLDPLPEDESGVDVSRVLRIFRDAVRDLSGWEVKSEVWLGQFSFTKFLLWKDLTDRLEDLTKNRVVRHLVHEAGTQIQNHSDDIRSHELDDRFHPREVLCPRSADSSQLAAVMAAADGHDFVLEGPPGTGKSQTITNIIAHCLAVGKRVLFVAEKRAALDVVHRRLREDGLEPFCLELHSNKTGKADVLAQFDCALKFAEEAQSTQWEQRASELERLRAALNAYTRALHRSLPCGLSAHRCMDYLLPRKDEAAVRLTWPSILETSEERLLSTRSLCRQMQDRSRNLMPLSDHALSSLECDEWTPGWAERCAELNDALLKLCGVTNDAVRELTSWMQLSRSLGRDDLFRLDALIEVLQTPEPVGPAFATTSWPELSKEIGKWRGKAEEREALRQSIAGISSMKRPGPAKCEVYSEQTANEVFREGEKLAVDLAEARDLSKAVLEWLGASQAEVSNELLMKLCSLAETLLVAEEVGASFPLAAPWDAWSLEMKRWIGLVRERADLRSKLVPYQEAALLSLDLAGLKQKWDKAQSTWFLPKMLNRNSVKGALRKALPRSHRLEIETMGDVLVSALRLRTINGELHAIRDSAEAMLGSSWREAEPSAESLEEIQKWGGMLNRTLAELAEQDEAWLERMRGILATSLQGGAKTLREGAVAGDLLASFRHRWKSFSVALEAFLYEAELISPGGDYFDTTELTLQCFLSKAPKLVRLNKEFIAASPEGEAKLGNLWERGEPSLAGLEKAIAWGEKLHSRIVAFASEDLVWLRSFRNLLSSVFAEGTAVYSSGTTIGGRFEKFRSELKLWNVSIEEYGAAVRMKRESLNCSTDYLATAQALLEKIASGWPKVRDWCLWQKSRQEAITLGLGQVVEKLEASNDTSLDVQGLFERSFRRTLLNAIIEDESVLRDFFGSEHNERVGRFREIDEQLQGLSRDLIRARLAAGIPRDSSKDDVPKEEIGLLRRELGKRMRHIPVRQLINRIPTLLPRLKPCVLMSPLSVAQYLEASHETFDVVVFDEASQIPVWDAVGAIARGRQLIIVGDPKQLPPTNFFSSGSDDEDDITPDEHKDLESILDEMMTHGLRHKRLQWHYRSRHEGLITFSNRQYYENDLLTFPSPELELGGVRFKYVADARYDKGKSRTNRLEAEALVGELISRLRDPHSPRRSYGVVTFSQAQQALVENLLDEERRKYPEVEHHFGDEPPVEGEPVFVKNLENVQGDERDVILFSICYGFDEAGKLSMNFGPLNRDGGERRLNVAVTRAKHEVLVFSGLRGDQIDLTKTQKRGVRDLKYFLEYAERGPKALTSATTSASLADADSEFERMVATKIRAAGYEVHHQVGCSGYRIDLAVVDPSAAGRYLLGIECDGATYHRASTARDRDKLRQAVLEGLGWKLHRIWSTDWWHDATGQIEKVLQALEDMRPQAEEPAIAS